MRRVVALLALSVLPLSAGCRADMADGPAGPERAASVHSSGIVASATGSGHQQRADGSLRKFTISAVAHADGTASGQYDLMVGPLDFLKADGISPPVLRLHGTVTCLTVVGSSAFIGATVDANTNAALFFGREDFTGAAIELIDNDGTGQPDEISAVAVYFPETGSTPQDYCDDPVPGPVSPIDQGNITVR